VNKANIYNTIEIFILLFFTFVINTSVIVFFAIYKSRGGHQSIISHIEDIEKYLQPIFESESVKYFWAIGLLMSGLGGTMTGTYAGQFVAEGFLNFKLPPWKRILIIRSMIIIPTFLIIAFNMDYFSLIALLLNRLQSSQLLFAIIPMMKFVSSDVVMGIEFSISKYNYWLGIVISIILFISNSIIIFIDDQIKLYARIILTLLVLFYVFCIIIILR